MTAATICSIRPRAFGWRPDQPGDFAQGRQPSPMAARRSTRAPIIRCRTASSPPGASASAPSSARSRDDCAVAALLFRRRRIGSRLRLSAAWARATSIDDPIGGRSLAEFALEARIRLKAFGGNFGIVPFLDGGTLSTDVTARTSEDWQFGAGLGVRYYSSFGPIRVDVGTPLNPRKDDGRIAVVGLARAGLLSGRASDHRRSRAAAPRPPEAGLAAPPGDELLVLLVALAGRWRSSGWSCSTRRRAIASSSTASPRSRPRPACASASAGSTGRSSARRG